MRREIKDPAEFRRFVRRHFQQRRAAADVPTPASSLREIRRDRLISQAELAVRMTRKQAEISKLERRRDMLVSTLAAYVRALGGSLELNARFPHLLVRLTLGG